ncbi:hypothetical protein B5P43_32690 [Bacillus sp. SRB_336]|nr:hypothetical protein B5P43_32690 [Bacillus sp. SRB_336]
MDYLAITGFIDAIGPAGGPQRVPLNLIGDVGRGGMYFVSGILATLLHVGRTGHGQVVNAAMVDAAVNMLASTNSAIAPGSWHAGRAATYLTVARRSSRSTRPWTVNTLRWPHSSLSSTYSSSVC